MQSELIQNRARARQILAFDGLQYGRCRPSDVDLSMDFGGKTFVFGELKGADKDITVGQRIHIEGLVKGLRAGGRTAWGFLANHDTPDPYHDVHVAQARVRKVFDGNVWEEVDKSVDELLDCLYTEHLKEHA